MPEATTLPRPSVVVTSVPVVTIPPSVPDTLTVPELRALGWAYTFPPCGMENADVIDVAVPGRAGTVRYRWSNPTGGPRGFWSR